MSARPDPFKPYEDEIAALEREISRLERGIREIIDAVGEQSVVDAQLLLRLLRGVVGP